MSDLKVESEIYSSALQRTLKELESRVRERKRLEADRRSLQVDEEERIKHRNEQRKLAYLRNAEELRYQMSINLERKRAQLREQKAPGIAPAFNGFPNIPETPGDVRRQRKREQQLSIKQSLDFQIRVKQESEQLAKNLLKAQELETNEKTKAEIERKRLEEIEKKQRFRTELQKTNEAAEAAKKMMKTIEGMKDMEIDAPPVTDFLEIRHYPTTENPLFSPVTERNLVPPPNEDQFRTEDPLPREPSTESQVQVMKQFSTESRRSKSNLIIPAPIVTVYKPTDQRDGSLTRSLGSQKVVPVKAAGTLAQNIFSPRSRSNPKWGFVTVPDPLQRGNRKIQLHATGLRVMKSQAAINWPVISTVKTMELRQTALPQYGMLLTKPRSINNV